MVRVDARVTLLVVLNLAQGVLGELGGLSVMGEYRPDRPFPQFLGQWSEKWTACPTGAVAAPAPTLGGYLHVHLVNSGEQSIVLGGAKLEGIDLDDAVAFGPRKISGFLPASIHFSTLKPAKREILDAAGWPLWWKLDPVQVPPGGAAELVIRLRHPPRVANLRADIDIAGGTASASIPIGPAGPHFAGISFGRDLSEVVVYARHPSGAGLAPIRVAIDGIDSTSSATISADPEVDVSVITLRLDKPLAAGSFHQFRADYQDGSRAVAGLRAWSDEFVYGMWGYTNKGATPEARAKFYLEDMELHQINALMQSYGGHVVDYMRTPEGAAWRRRAGIRAMLTAPGGLPDPLYYFLMDEPDAHDHEANELPAHERLGVLGQSLVLHARGLREQDAATPQMLNIDNTYKPDNWYTYGQLADVLSADPYYQEQQRIVYNQRPGWAGAFAKPTYVLGVSTICQSACAPRPLHIILNAVRHDLKDSPFRFATPEEKQVEAFYALAGGARGLSYWWYTPYGEFHGCGSDDAAGVALWTRIGLIGAQLRTAGELIARSCPADIPVEARGRLAVWSLLSGADTVLLLIVNENFTSDRLGTVVVPAENSAVTLRPPAWLDTEDAFEITAGGVQNVTWAHQGGRVAIDLGRTTLTRLLVVTGDRGCRERLSRLHRERFAANAAALLRGSAAR